MLGGIIVWYFKNTSTSQALLFQLRLLHYFCYNVYNVITKKLQKDDSNKFLSDTVSYAIF